MEGRHFYGLPPPYRMPEGPRRWQQTFNLRTDDTSAAGEVTPPALCAVLQDAASQHAAALRVSPAHLPNQTWFLAGLSLRLFHRLDPALPLIVHTWPCGTERLLALRAFTLTQDGQPVGKALSRWLLIDRERRRPARIPDAIAALAEEPVPELPYHPAVEPWEGSSAHTWPLTVRHMDIDANQHVNNTRYVSWMTEAVFQQEGPRALQALQVRFDREAAVDAALRVETVATGAHRFGHRIIREADDTPLVQGRTAWRAIEAATGRASTA